jgi:3-hydroxyisobutyrate dehydrogenase-like beta-hydroxyacid dehydrogenase
LQIDWQSEEYIGPKLVLQSCQVRPYIMQSNKRKMQRIAFVGFGEAGGILGSELAKVCEVRTYDILIATPTRDALRAKAESARVTLSDTLEDAVTGVDIVVSAVTASAARQVAVGVARIIKPGQWFLDINSVSPETKRDNGRIIEAAGASYIEAAVMAPVPPQRIKVPMLLGGPHAKSVAEQLRLLGMNTTAVSDQIGVASAIKMCRSIMIKGLEALTVESMLAARRYGAEDAVLASLHATFPSLGFDADFPDYLISRVAEHGRRRAAEMREVAHTLEDVKIQPLMASATAKRQDELIDAMQAARYKYDASQKFLWRDLADALAEQ